MPEDVVHQVNQFVEENRSFTITDILTRFSDISRSTLHRIVSGNFNYHKFCASSVPQQIADVYKARVNLGYTFLKRLEMKGKEFLHWK